MITIANTADVDDTASIGDGRRIWHLAQIREDATLGTNCNIGRGAYVGPAVQLGDCCKLQNYSLVYEPARLSDGVFIGPAAVLTNDLHPRLSPLTEYLRVPMTGSPSVLPSAEAPPLVPVPSVSPRLPSVNGPPSLPEPLSPGMSLPTQWWPACPRGRWAG